MSKILGTNQAREKVTSCGACRRKHCLPETSDMPSFLSPCLHIRTLYHLQVKRGERGKEEVREGEKREGEKREGEKREGEKREGEMRKGEKREGEKREGEKREGEMRKGEKREGKKK